MLMVLLLGLGCRSDHQLIKDDLVDWLHWWLLQQTTQARDAT